MRYLVYIEWAKSAQVILYFRNTKEKWVSVQALTLRFLSMGQIRPKGLNNP